MEINKDLKRYITEYIFPKYAKNDSGHQISHIQYVIDRSLMFASKINDIDFDMVYTVAAYHDIGHHIDAKNHEKVSAEILAADKKIKKFFTQEQIKTMSEAVFDHRSSMDGEPRNIYGKIVSSADRNTSLEAPLKRTYAYRVVHSPNSTLEENIEESRQHILNKFGQNGYAVEKMYFKDPDYEKFLKDITALAKDKEKFRTRYLEVNHIKISHS